MSISESLRPRHATWRAVVLAGVLSGLAGCGVGASSSPLASLPASVTGSLGAAPTGSASAAATGPPTADLTELDHLQLELAGGPDWPAFLDESVWILAPDGPLQGGHVGPLVYRIDAKSGEERARIPIDGRLCQGIAAGFGSLWACSDAGLARIDPASNEIVAVVPFPAARVFLRPVMTEDRVWMLSGNVVGDRLVEIDPASNRVVATHELGHAAAGLAFGGGALWATVPAEGVVVRFDPSSGKATVLAEGLPAPSSIAFGAGSLWVGLYGEHGGAVAAAGEPTIARLSPADGTVEAEIAVGTTTMVEGDIWAGTDAVWVRSPGDPFLVNIDPSTDRVTYAISGFHSGGSLTVVDRMVWTTSIEFGTVWRIAP